MYAVSFEIYGDKMKNGSALRQQPLWQEPASPNLGETQQRRLMEHSLPSVLSFSIGSSLLFSPIGAMLLS